MTARDVTTNFKQPKAEKKPHRRRTTKGAGAKGKATALHSKIVRAQAGGICERCGLPKTLECAHIVSRRYTATRTDLKNAWGLCNFCHRWLGEHPELHIAFAIQTRGEDGWRALLDRAYSGTKKKFDWDAELARLKAIASEMGLS